MKTNTIKTLAALLGSGILLVSSCKKEEAVAPVSPANPTSTPSALGSFFTTNLQAATQKFTIDANSNQTITGAKGTRLIFQSNTFKKASGAIATGNINIELVEIQSKADMILLNKTTTSNGKLLISGGEISIKAFQSGEQLTLANNSSSIYVQMPSNNPGSTNMILFAGQPTATGDVNWQLTGLNGPNNVVQPDTIPGTGGNNGAYSFYLGGDSIPTGDSLGWINCDYFVNGSSSVTITTPSNHDYSNTALYIYFNNLNSVTSLSASQTNNTFSVNYLPVGSQVKIVAISKINGQYYSSITPATLTANFTLSISLNTTTLSALNNDIQNL